MDFLIFFKRSNRSSLVNRGARAVHSGGTLVLRRLFLCDDSVVSTLISCPSKDMLAFLTSARPFICLQKASASVRAAHPTNTLSIMIAMLSVLMTVGIVLGEVLLGFWKRVVVLCEGASRRSVFVVDYSQDSQEKRKRKIWLERPAPLSP